ncbi:MAG: FAD-dependent oxidoreductase [Blautia sp.]|nr:FAD-dependent oxidoreductase [Blautia sp.]
MKKTNNLSRLEFLKGAAAGAATFAVSGLLGSAALAEEAPVGGLYTPGTYTATAMGIGDVTVTMTFDETSITDVVVDVSKETKDIGQLYGETLQEALMQLQSADIDSVAGATVTSDAVKEAAANCIAQAMGVAIPEAETADVGEEMSWKEAPEPISDDQISQTIDTDVLVVGHGYAGLNACRYLASRGIQVTLIESQTEENYRAMGNEAGTPNASILKKRGVPEIDPIEYYNNWMLNSGYQANPELMMKFCRNSGEAMDEYLSVLTDEELEIMTTAFYPPTEKQMSSIGPFKFWPSTCSFYSRECDQTYIHKKNREKAIADGATFLFGTEAQQLIKEGDEIVGLIARNTEGEYIKFQTKAVILASGGFGANRQMQKDLLTDLGGTLTPDESFSVLMDSDGRGIQMGYWAGGKLDSLGIPTMNGKHYHPGYPQGIWLDSNGRRYCNEYWGPIEFRGRPALQMNRDGFYAFYDSNLTEYLKYSVPSHGSTYASEENLANIQAELDNAMAAGAQGVEGHDLSATFTRYAAETLDELLDMVCQDDIVKANIRASIERYNEMCANGRDEDFGRQGDLLFPVKDGPFYCDIKPSEIGWMMCTCGGLVINADQQVLDEYYHPIKGLFASGNCASGRFGTEYFTPTPGVSLGTTIVLGRECGKSVEKYLKSEL